MTNKDKTIKQFEFLIVNKIAKMATVKQCYLLDDLLCSFTHTINIQANDVTISIHLYRREAGKILRDLVVRNKYKKTRKKTNFTQIFYFFNIFTDGSRCQRRYILDSCTLKLLKIAMDNTYTFYNQDAWSI